jgi:predicted histidine transporter YuiF (NhaC family)
MTTLIASPAQRIAAQVGPDAMLGTDPYALGFCVASYNASETREVAMYALGEDLNAYISYNLKTGFAVVIRKTDGAELLACRVADEEEIRMVVARYIN